MSAAAIAVNVTIAVLLIAFVSEEWVDLPHGVGPGPKQMTRQQLEAADDLELLWLSRSYKRPAVDPAWAAGLERMWDAARDHTNTPEGEA